MEQSGNAAIALEFARRVQGEGRLDLIDDFVHPDFRNRTAERGVPADRAGVHRTMRALREAFADRSVETVHCVEADGVVASHRILRGRHVGPWLGQTPTGERVALRIMDFLRFEDGRIIEHWSALRPVERGDDQESPAGAATERETRAWSPRTT